MNIPNQLTVARLVMTLVFVAVLSVPFPWSASIALLLFIAASITDYLDGMIARKYGLVTNFGKLMDPLVDKILTCSGFIMLSGAPHALVPAWTVVVILAREFLVTGLRLVAGSHGDVLAADSFGKWKTTTQIATIIYFLAWLASAEAGPAGFLLRPLFLPGVLQPPVLGLLLVAATLITTVGSGWTYLWRNRRLLFAEV